MADNKDKAPASPESKPETVTVPVEDWKALVARVAELQKTQDVLYAAADRGRVAAI